MTPTHPQKTGHTAAVFSLAGTAFLWSFGGVLVKWVSWNPLAIAGMRSLIALPFLLIAFRGNRFRWSGPQIGGALAYTATVILFVSATKLTTAANAIVLEYTAPFYVALFSGIFLGEPVKGLDWAAIVAACGGMVLFFFDKLAVGMIWGNILAILNGMAFAAMILFLRKQKDGHPLTSVILGNALTGLLCLPFMFQSHPNPTGWIGLVLLGVFQIGLSYFLYSEAIKHVTALEGILIPMVVPVLNPLWVLLFLGEKPGRFALIGGIVVIGSVMARSIISIIRDPADRMKKIGKVNPVRAKD